MKNSMNSSVQQPMIVKYVESLHNGIQSQALSRYAIGYILRGTKYIYDGDKRQTLSRGDVFYLGIGHHYIENFPEGGQPFEQVLFYYTPGDLQRILMHLNITYGLNISNEHSCENCRNRSHVSMPAWNSIRNFFVNTNNYLRDEDFHRDSISKSPLQSTYPPAASGSTSPTAFVPYYSHSHSLSQCTTCQSSIHFSLQSAEVLHVD